MTPTSGAAAEFVAPSDGGNNAAADAVPPKDRFWCPHPGCRRSFAELW